LPDSTTPEHRAHEREQQGMEAGRGVVGRQVVAGIEHHQAPIALTSDAEDPGQAVDAQDHVDAQAGKPGPAGLDDAAVGDFGEERREHQQVAHGHGARQRRLRIARAGGDKGRQRTGEERGGDHPPEGHAASVGGVSRRGGGRGANPLRRVSA
jgi:hypothetical protein